jgi:hypothetical protein
MYRSVQGRKEEIEAGKKGQEEKEREEPETEIGTGRS